MIGHIVAALQKEMVTGVVADEKTPEAMAYVARCTLDVGMTTDKGARFMYTRSIEGGLHSIHLSLSFRKAPYTAAAPFDHRFARRAVPEFFGEDLKHVLVYRPQHGEGRRWNIWHFRLFTGQDWKANGYAPARAADDLTWFDWQEYALMRFG